ncbi:MAG: shikimate kinase [Eubacteriales bacterium]
MKYGLVGEHLSHSFSKEIHESLAPYTYELCEIERERLRQFFRQRGFCAVNVTIPYKAEVIPYLDYVSETAQKLNAVNTVVNRNGKLYGYNTDYYGMRDLILRSGADISGKKVLVLGTGGTSRTSALVAKDLGAREILLVSREQKSGAVTYDEVYALHADAQIIINATPVGMYPNCFSSPIDIGCFDALEAVFDAVYNPLRTPLVLGAKERGLIADGGLYMLVSQAVYAAEYFLDCRIEKSKSEEIYKKILKEKENIVLIGMPASGKTTVGNIVAGELGREFFDIDSEIEKKLGMTIAQYFENHSEGDFRDIESEITKEVSKHNGAVIATGGGCVLRGENIRALRQNGRIYMLDRSPDLLAPDFSRPLARSDEAIKELYCQRYGVYTSECDVKINSNVPSQDVAALIREEFSK